MSKNLSCCDVIKTMACDILVAVWCLHVVVTSHAGIAMPVAIATMVPVTTQKNVLCVGSESKICGYSVIFAGVASFSSIRFEKSRVPACSHAKFRQKFHEFSTMNSKVPNFPRISIGKLPENNVFTSNVCIVVAFELVNSIDDSKTPSKSELASKFRENSINANCRREQFTELNFLSCSSRP